MYFPNGTSGEQFEHTYCRNCLHYKEPDEGTCAVWMLHLQYNYEQADEGMRQFTPTLSVHGPTVKLFLDGLGPNDCTMYLPRVPQGEGNSWCAALRHRVSMKDANRGAPCVLCLAEEV